MDKFLLEGSGLSKTFDGKIPIFKNVDIVLENRKSLGIAGKNGSGKSTLLKIFAGLLAPTMGNITLNVNPLRMHAVFHATRFFDRVCPRVCFQGRDNPFPCRGNSG